MKFMFFNSKDDAIAMLKKVRDTSSYLKPKMYPLSVTIPANSTKSGQITISSEGPFYMEKMNIQFGFDSNDKPRVKMSMVDKSNGSIGTTANPVELSTIASIGQEGNQLVNSFPIEGYYQSRGAIDFEFDNYGDEISVVNLVLIGWQFTTN